MQDQKIHVTGRHRFRSQEATANGNEYKIVGDMVLIPSHVLRDRIQLDLDRVQMGVSGWMVQCANHGLNASSQSRAMSRPPCKINLKPF